MYTNTSKKLSFYRAQISEMSTEQEKAPEPKNNDAMDQDTIVVVDNKEEPPMSFMSNFPINRLIMTDELLQEIKKTVEFAGMNTKVRFDVDTIKNIAAHCFKIFPGAIVGLYVFSEIPLDEPTSTNSKFYKKVEHLPLIRIKVDFDLLKVFNDDDRFIRHLKLDIAFLKDDMRKYVMNKFVCRIGYDIEFGESDDNATGFNVLESTPYKYTRSELRSMLTVLSDMMRDDNPHTMAYLYTMANGLPEEISKIANRDYGPIYANEDIIH